MQELMEMNLLIEGPKMLTRTLEVRHYNVSSLCRVSDPMLNPVPMSVHFLDYLNFGALTL